MSTGARFRAIYGLARVELLANRWKLRIESDYREAAEHFALLLAWRNMAVHRRNNRIRLQNYTIYNK